MARVEPRNHVWGIMLGKHKTINHLSLPRREFIPLKKREGKDRVGKNLVVNRQKSDNDKGDSPIQTGKLELDKTISQGTLKITG